MHSGPTPARFDALRRGLAGTLYEPADDGYAALATPWNVAVATSPAAVAEVATAQDVVAAVRFAADHDLPVAVQATGHGIASDLDGALLIHTRRLDECTISPEGWARTGAGVTWRTVLAASATHGLAGLCGSAPDVSVAGYTSGGGIGPLARTYGAASDRVRSFDLVTGDGLLRHVTAETEPDLFWGVRGGKGSLGVITAVEFDLLDLAEVYAGALIFGTDDVAAVSEAWAQWCPGLPAEATTSLAWMQLPPLPGVPEALAGKFTAAVRYVYAGNHDDGARWLAPLRAAGAPLMDLVGPMPYAMIGMVHADPEDPMPAAETSALLAGFPAAAVGTLLDAAGPGTGSPQTIVEIRQFGGALGAEPAIPSALCHRDAAFNLYMVAAGAPPDLPAKAGHAVGVNAAMEPWSFGGTVPNFAGRAPFASSYTSGTLDRLTALASRYDPQHLFRLGQVPVR
ncbi:FAD-binding oxidoreductase [Specibacter cremeus]|uniref:FAD-binding oxidoreductase n=1 Tax=Specibacter cremeus TaxID=1629051 RepID=UPI000F7BA62E|nr:FAD-binding oxidoreductase [Specibacter cremeus]